MTYSKQYGLQPADRIKTSIFLTGLSKHHSIYLGMDQTGTEWIAENHYTSGVRLVNAADFFGRNKDVSVFSFAGTNYQRQVAVKRALSKLGQPYDLISFNCEHYAEYVQRGAPYSEQVAVVRGLIAMALIIMFVVGLYTYLAPKNNS